MWPYIDKEIEKIYIPREVFLDFKKKTNETCIYHAITFSSFDLPKRIELPDAIDNNAYHLFFYMLCRFYYFDNGKDDIYFYYPKKNKNYLCEKALAHLPPRFKRETQKHDNFEYIDMPALGWRLNSIDEKWVYSYVRDLYKPLWESIPQEKGKFSFISRNTYFSPSRRCLNEKDLIIPLKELGFNTYYMETLTFEEQIRLYRSSEIIVAIHGAGMSWGIFCHPGTIYCEINHPNKILVFEDIGRTMGLRYYRFMAVKEPECLTLDSEGEKRQPTENNPLNDLIIDETLFFECIKHFISLTQPTSAS